MLPITRKISVYNHSAGNDIKYIVIHDTGNRTDSDEGNSSYFGAANRGASAHLFVDDDSITQVVEFNEGAWHCGDGGGAYGITNHNSIGIEMCRVNNTVTPTTEQNTIELVKFLMAKFNIPLDRVVRHYDASRKPCPKSFSANNWARWNEFKNKLTGNSATVAGTTTTTDYGLARVNTDVLNVRDGAGTSFTKIGTKNRGEEVKIGFIQNNWANIYFGDHGGWVSMDYLNVTKVFKKPEQPQTISSNSDETLRVVVGSYTDRKNAEEVQRKLKEKGFDSFLLTFSDNGKNFLRVIAGSYKERQNALDQQAKLKATGFDSFLASYSK